MEKFPHNVKCKTEIFPFQRTILSGEITPTWGWPNKVEIDQKKPKKIYVTLEFKQKLMSFCTLLKNCY